MKKFFRYSLFYAFFMLLHTTNIYGVETPRQIARIIEQLSCELPEKGTFICSSVDMSFPLYIERNDVAVTQVGLRLFTEDMRADLDHIVCNAVERLMLELKLSSDVKKQKKLLKEYQVTLVFNGFNLGTVQFPSLDNALRLFQNDALVTMKVENKQIILRVQSGDDVWMITMPADRELLYAYDKKEHEDILKNELESWSGKYKKNQLPTKAELQNVEEGVYLLPGMSYMIDSLKSDSYYTVNGEQVLPLFEKSQPVKSLQNLLLGCVEKKDVSVKLRYRTYDREEKYCSMPLSSFLGYMQSQGLELYSAVYSQENNELRGLLLMFHPIYNYTHMVIVNYDKAIFGANETCLFGEFYTFIPQHNIKNLFNY
ncbi:MAG: hypothetical protein IKY64_08795 [Bacteroidaceae bacterium]|nr:hypothetical protein [Bacteroidaceae bacterium]